MDFFNLFVSKASTNSENKQNITNCPTAQLQKYEFLRLVTPDLNGIHLTKLVHSRHAEKLLRGGCEAFVGMIAIGARCEMIHIPEVSKAKYCNGPIRICMETLRPLPWVTGNGGCTPVMAEVIFESLWPDGSPVLAHPRLVARKQLEELHELGFTLYSAFEPEFRVFKEDTTHPGNYIPANPNKDIYKLGVAVEFEKLFVEMERMFQVAHIDVQDYIVENGAGQLESPLLPKCGIEAADMAFSFRQAVREIAQMHGLKVSFMSKPIPNDSGSGWHFNHSLVRNGTLERVMFDPEGESNLSETMLHWVGGLMTHLVALTAITSPTVNCYRRLCKHLAPSRADWNIDDRFASVRVKTGTPQRTYLELRTVSSAACPYHVLAATVAAGIDGLKRKLMPPPRGQKDAAPEFPHTLEEALQALERDEIIVQALGQQFVDWFVRLKREGCVEKLKTVDLQRDDDESLKLERERYFDFI